MGLANKGEVSDEITGGASILREKSLKVTLEEDRSRHVWYWWRWKTHS